MKRSAVQCAVHKFPHTDIIACIFIVYNYQNKDLQDAFKYWFSLSRSPNLPWISSSSLSSPFPPPFNIKALMLPLHVQIFESTMKTLITLMGLPDLTVNKPPFRRTYWF